MDGQQVARLWAITFSRMWHAAHSRAAQFWKPFELRPRREHATPSRRPASRRQFASNWLVDEKASRAATTTWRSLMPFWQMTSEQDWRICERQQRGVNSSAYAPGPYSTFKEYNVESFVRWYMKSEACCVRRENGSQYDIYGMDRDGTSCYSG